MLNERRCDAVYNRSSGGGGGGGRGRLNRDEATVADVVVVEEGAGPRAGRSVVYSTLSRTHCDAERAQTGEAGASAVLATEADR